LTLPNTPRSRLKHIRAPNEHISCASSRHTCCLGCEQTSSPCSSLHWNPLGSLSGNLKSTPSPTHGIRTSGGGSLTWGHQGTQLHRLGSEAPCGGKEPQKGTQDKPGRGRKNRSCADSVSVNQCTRPSASVTGGGNKGEINELHPVLAVLPARRCWPRPVLPSPSQQFCQWKVGLSPSFANKVAGAQRCGTPAPKSVIFMELGGKRPHCQRGMHGTELSP
jgi:hypothetical protein